MRVMYSLLWIKPTSKDQISGLAPSDLTIVKQPAKLTNSDITEKGITDPALYIPFEHHSKTAFRFSMAWG